MVAEDNSVRFPRHPRGRPRAIGAPASARPAVQDVRSRGGRPDLASRPAGAAPPYDVPLQPNAIVGREQEIAAGRERLMSADVRLLTVTGPPGVGKTRVALQLASVVRHEFPAGVRFVDLAAVGDPLLVTDAIARALGFQGVDRRVVEQVIDEFLADKSLLLILDNFEQVIDAADLVGRLCAACPLLKVVVTSREPLHLGWERELPVPPLELPSPQAWPSAQAVSASPAGQLFVQRAQAVAPDFVLGDADAAAVAEICERLDGLPLAIELAAARVKLFPPRALLRRLRQAREARTAEASALWLLADQARDMPSRHHTLLSAIAWSYDLLNRHEQTLLRRLSVFVEGFTLEAAEAVGGFDMREGLALIGSLVDKSLVLSEQQPDGEPRLRLLETIREYARERLALTDESEAIHARHAAFYLELAEHAARELIGPRQQHWFAWIERDRANLQAVERWASAERRLDITVRLWAALWPYWLAREDASHTRSRLDSFVPIVDQVRPTLTLAHALALHGAGLLAEKLGDYATCRALLERGVTLARELGEPRALAALLDSLGRQEFIERRFGRARLLLNESYAIWLELDDRIGLARVLSHLGFLEHLEHRPAAARSIFEQGLALAVAADDQHRVAEYLDNLGNVSVVQGDLDNARSMFQEAISIWRDLGQGHWLAMALNNLGRVELRRHELGAARGHLHEALTLAHRMGNRRRMAYTLLALAEIEAAEHHAQRAAVLQAVAQATLGELGAYPPHTGQEPPPSLTGPEPTPMPALTSHAALARSAPATTASLAAGMVLSLERAVEDTLARLAGRQTSTDGTASFADALLAPAPELPADLLTRREREVVGLLMRGLTNRQIAQTLVLTEGTVENYVQRILGKLGFNNRAQIAVWAAQHGIRAADG